MRSHWLLLSLSVLVGSLASSAAVGESAERVGPSSRSVEIEVALAADSSSVHQGMLVAVPVLTGRLDEEPLRRPLTIPGKITLELAEQTTWRISLEAEGLWTATRLAKVGPVDTKVPLVARSAGWVEARLTGSRPEGLPKELRLEIQGLEAESSLRATEHCPVVDGVLHCALPVGRYDVRLGAEGWAPSYHWGLEIEAGETNDLGSLRLRRGASLIGWVLAPDRSADLATTEVELVPWLAGVPDAGTQARRGALIRRPTRVDDRGFFQIAGIEPGRYVLVARHPEYASSRSAELVVEGSDEVEIEAIELRPAARLELAIRHPTDPFNNPWVIALHRSTQEAGSPREPIEGRTDPRGELVLEGLDPGSYLLDAEDSRGGRWLARRLELHSGSNPLRLEIAFRRLEGRLLWHDEPLAGAAVTLQQIEGNARIHDTSREDGRFYVFLPGGVAWDIQVLHDAESIAALFTEFEVPPRESDEPWARHDFEIPDTEVTGRVVDGSGHRITDPVMVDVRQQPGGGNLSRPARNGEFVLRGLAPGSAALMARFDGSVTSRRGSSPRVEIEVVEDREGDPIDLVLEESRRLEGLVTGPSGSGLPGVEILPVPESTTGQPLGFWIPTFYTDFDGVFELELPAATEGLQLTVFPPGFAVTQLRIDVRQDSSVIVPVETVGGRVVVRYEDPEPGWKDRLRLQTALFHHHGIPSFFLMRWAAGFGGVGQGPPDTWAIPGLEPGPYRACFGKTIGAYLGVGGIPSPALMDRWCSEPGFLAPGGELVLTIPHRVMVADFESSGAR